MVCNDNDPCTDDVCTDGVGCEHTPSHAGVACSDSNACTENDSCLAGKCVPGKPLVCDDGKACTADSCNKQNGCQFQPFAAGQPCNDGNPCTTGECNAVQECVATPVKNGQACNDGVCFVGGTCTDGECVDAKLKSCDDGVA